MTIFFKNLSHTIEEETELPREIVIVSADITPRFGGNRFDPPHEAAIDSIEMISKNSGKEVWEEDIPESDMNTIRAKIWDEVDLEVKSRRRQNTMAFEDAAQIVAVYPSQCSCGHIFLEKYQFRKITPEGYIGFCWCGFCKTRLNVRPSQLSGKDSIVM